MRSGLDTLRRRPDSSSRLSAQHHPHAATSRHLPQLGGGGRVWGKLFHFLFCLIHLNSNDTNTRTQDNTPFVEFIWSTQPHTGSHSFLLSVQSSSHTHCVAPPLPVPLSVTFLQRQDRFTAVMGAIGPDREAVFVQCAPLLRGLSSSAP